MGFLDGAALTRSYSLKALNMLLYDALVQSVMKIVEKLDLSLQKVNTDDEVESKYTFVSTNLTKGCCRVCFFF